MKIKISDAQMTALETAGVFEPGDDEWGVLRDAITGSWLLAVTPEIVSAINEISNHDDALVGEFSVNDERRAWARTDARVLSNLYLKALDQQETK